MSMYIREGVSVRIMWLGLAVSVLLAVVLPLRASAATGQGSNITTSPISLDTTVRPGETKTETLQVQNNGSTAVDIAVEATTFVAKGSNGQASFGVNKSDPALKYVSFSPSLVHANPGVWYQVQMTISMPTDATLGYYYAALFKPKLAVNNNKNTNTFLPGNAILVLVDSASGSETRGLKIDSFTSKQKVYEYLPATFSVNVHNSGNIFQTPKGNVFISRDSSFNSSIATLPLNKDGGRILPGSNRVFTVVWRDGFPVFVDKTSNGQPVTNKNGTVLQQLKWDFQNTNNFRFGKYYARLVLVYNDGTRDVPIYAVVSFWVIPWKLLLVLLAFILLQVLLIIGFIRYRNMYRRSKRGQAVKVTHKQHKED